MHFIRLLPFHISFHGPSSFNATSRSTNIWGYPAPSQCGLKALRACPGESVSKKLLRAVAAPLTRLPLASPAALNTPVPRMGRVACVMASFCAGRDCSLLLVTWSGPVYKRRQSILRPNARAQKPKLQPRTRDRTHPALIAFPCFFHKNQQTHAQAFHG